MILEVMVDRSISNVLPTPYQKVKDFRGQLKLTSFVENLPVKSKHEIVLVDEVKLILVSTEEKTGRVRVTIVPWIQVESLGFDL